MDKKKLKIAFLCRDVGRVHRGVETYVLELSKRLKKDHDVEVLSGSDAYSLSNIISGKYDLVIPTNGRTQALKASLGRFIGGGYKMIISGQSGIGRDDIWNIFITMPDVYVAITELEKNWAKNFALLTKVTEIPNGVDLEKFSPKGERINLDMSQPVILSVGALTWYKHHERSIQALKNLNQGSLLIMGAGPEKEKLENLARSLGVEERVKILQVPFEEIPAYYRSADLFVLPSWDRESFGIVYLEAMASGLPVVAPDDLSRKEIVGNGGILVDVGDIEKYTQAIKEALDKKWGDLPRKQAEKFSWDNVADQYNKLIGEMFP